MKQGLRFIDVSGPGIRFVVFRKTPVTDNFSTLSFFSSIMHRISLMVVAGWGSLVVFFPNQIRKSRRNSMTELEDISVGRREISR